MKIRKLATVLGVALYERDGRDLVLTPAGHAVAGFARRLDDEVGEFVASLLDPVAIAPLVLAAGAGAHLYVLPQAERRLLAREQGLRLLTLDRDRTIDAVRAREADVGVAVIGSTPRGLASVPIATYPQVLVLPAGHPLARRRSLHLSDLEDAALVVPPPDRPHRRTLESALRRAKVRWHVAIEADGWAPMLHFVSIGAGLAVVNGCVAPPEGLVARPVDDLPSVTYAALLRPERRHDPRVETVLDVIRTSAP